MANKPATRKPGVPAEVKAFLSKYDRNVQDIALEARALVLRAAPEALEQIDVPARMLAYGFAATYKDMICVIMPQKSYVNFGFPRGSTLDDPKKLLTGTGKKARHVKLSDITQVYTPELRALLEESIEQIKP
jgi:hypothetical protein